MMQLVPNETQLKLSFIEGGMNSVETKDFDRRVDEWHKRGFVVLIDSGADTVSCILFKPVLGTGGSNLKRLEEFRGEGDTPLAAIIAAGARYGEAALF